MESWKKSSTFNPYPYNLKSKMTFFFGVRSMRKSVVINCQDICMVSFQSIPPKSVGPEALFTGDGLIKEQNQRGSVMIMHFSSFYLDLLWGLPLSLFLPL